MWRKACLGQRSALLRVIATTLVVTAATAGFAWFCCGRPVAVALATPMLAGTSVRYLRHRRRWDRLISSEALLGTVELQRFLIRQRRGRPH
jgi:hypothetical protein